MHIPSVPISTSKIKNTHLTPPSGKIIFVPTFDVGLEGQ